MRADVAAFVTTGPLPNWDADEAQIAHRQAQLEAITGPVSDAEAAALAQCFGPDDCYGLAWTLLHLIETGPHPVIAAKPALGANPWHHTLWMRAVNGGLIAGTDGRDFR
ncbi:hypothetical protein [Nocardia sp. NPDC056100]|uniref:hypothetical protein n=1 Tax=Nocardia sp. NPDC056100 TaxID=3345712 RepID=UPI0035DC2AEB